MQASVYTVYITEWTIKWGNVEYTVSVNSNAPHFHTEGLRKKHVHDVDEVCKEDFSPAGCLRA